MMNRRKFLQAVGATTLFVACKEKVDDIIPNQPEDKVLFRFAVASDIHWGEADTNYESHTRNFVSAFQDFNKKNSCDFLVLNGDLIHNDPIYLPEVQSALKDAHPKLYVTQGNHDRVSNDVWKQTWGQAVNSDFAIDNMAFIFGSTLGPASALYMKGPDLDFLEQSLEKYKNKEHVFIFWHIYPHSSNDEPRGSDVNVILQKYSNIRAVFNGHDHNEEGIRTIQQIPYMFDGRLGGSWGSFDRNFRVVEITKSEIVSYLMTPSTRKRLNRFKL